MNKLFNIENVEVVKDTIRKGLNFPYINLYHSTLGGNENISLLLTLSLDNREAWANGILENSAYCKLHILNYGVIELICKSRNISKIRKTRFKSIDDLINKINNKVLPLTNI